MTVVQEHMMLKEYQKYYEVRLVEFLDLIGRVAEVKYKDIMGLTLLEKIILILEALFELNGDEVIIPNQGLVEEFSCSDEDY